MLGIAIALVGELMDWSYGLSFVVLAATGAIVSMGALGENPRTWFRHPPKRRRATNG